MLYVSYVVRLDLVPFSSAAVVSVNSLNTDLGLSPRQFKRKPDTSDHTQLRNLLMIVLFSYAHVYATLYYQMSTVLLEAITNQDLILSLHLTVLSALYNLFHFPFSVPVAQLRSVQEELDSLEEEKASELWEAQEELRVAQEEVQELQQAAEEAAAERENDIALLQEELCRLRAELQRLHNTTQEYELELTTLRAEISMKSQRREEQERTGTEGQLYSTPLYYSIIYYDIIFSFKD